MRRLSTPILTLTALLLSGVATADERSEAAIEARQGLLKVVGSYFGPIVGMARNQIDYDADVVAHNAAKVSQLAAMIPDVFRHDTSAAGLASGSLDHIWDNQDDFNAKAATVAERAAALAAAAPDGKAAAMQAFGALGGSCKACHDEYRQQD